MAPRRSPGPIPLDSARRAVRARIARAPSLFIALDYDGTLVPIASRPELARPAPETLAVLASLTATPRVRVAVLSGRRLDELKALLPVSGLIFAGLHGLEVRPPVHDAAWAMDKRGIRTELKRLLRRLRERLGDAPAPRIEDKGQALAFHFRGFPPSEIRRMRQAVRDAFEALGDETPIRLAPGKQVLEARRAGIDKGRCALALSARAGRGSLPIVLGDDVTDEDLFAAFAADGITVRVGRRSGKTQARYWVRSPEEVLHWLREILRIRQEAPARRTRSLNREGKGT